MQIGNSSFQIHIPAMPISLEPECLEGIPPLAWIAALPSGSMNVRVLHGCNVDLFDSGFFEGAWDGSHTAADFHTSANVFGSGGRLSNEGLIFVGPSHTLEPIYIAQTPQLKAVSNSLPFLLKFCNLSFDLKNFSYGSKFSAIVYGLQHTPQTFALNGGSLTILYHRNAVLTADGTVSFVAKTLPPAFADYNEYASYLRDVTARTFANAADTGRKFQYRPLATISSGYDSAASAAIATACGCTEAVSLTTSNKGEHDSGRSVAEALGLRHTEYERMQRAPNDDLLEAEFLASGMQGEDIVYSVFDDLLHGRILTTGFAGTIWYKFNPCMVSYRRGDISGCSLGEFRLWRNFLHFPLTFVGGLRCPEIRKISNSAEMAAYSVGGDHDRPVPRRILEDAGVPRDAFGQSKRGTSVLLFQGRNRLSRSSLKSIDAYFAGREGYGRFLLELNVRLAWWNLGRNLYRASIKLRQFFGIRRESPLPVFLARWCSRTFGITRPVYGASHPRFTMLLIWSNARLQERYAAAGRLSLVQTPAAAVVSAKPMLAASIAPLAPIQ